VPPERLALLDDGAAIVEGLRTAPDATLFLQERVFPMSAALATALAAELEAGHCLPELLERIGQDLRNASFAPHRVSWGGEVGLLPFTLGLHVFARVERSEDLSSLVNRASIANNTAPTGDLGPTLQAVVRRQQQKLRKRLKHIEADRDRYADPDGAKQAGELLLANLYRLRRGMDRIVVDDYYQDPPVPRTITLDPQMTPQDNAERYFKLYRKARRAGEHHERRLQETRQELDWLGQVELALGEAESPDDLYQVQLELEAAGLLKAAKGQLGRRPAPDPAAQLHQSVTPGGHPIFWGRNNRSNDYVSRELTGAKDLWMHAHNLPGCHLVLKTEGRPERVPEQDVLFAAALAAGYSKGRDAGKVEVMVAEGRAVRKPKGAKPGLVTVDSYRTVMVAPSRLDTK